MTRDVVKAIGGAVTSVGTGLAVSAVPLATIAGGPLALPLMGCVFVGKLVVGDMLAEKAVEHFERRVDEISDYLNELAEKPEIKRSK